MKAEKEDTVVHSSSQISRPELIELFESRPLGRIPSHYLLCRVFAGIEGS